MSIKIIKIFLHSKKNDMITAKMNLEKNLSPDALIMVKQLAEVIKPLIEDTHNMQPISKNYYAEYMGILSRAAEGKPQGYIKLMAIVLLYVGCHPDGVSNAVKLLTN